MALDSARIVAEALALLDEQGLEGLSLRKLAARLEVRQPSLYWHIPNKQALITGIAEAILDQEFAEPEPPAADESWQSWLIGIAERLRRALLAHPDGARIVAIAQLSLELADLTEQAMSALVARGVPVQLARMTVLTVRGFTIGFVLEEQSAMANPPTSDEFDLDQYARAYPTIMAGIAEYFGGGRNADDLFRDCVSLIVAGGAAGELDRGTH